MNSYAWPWRTQRRRRIEVLAVAALAAATLFTACDVGDDAGAGVVLQIVAPAIATTYSGGDAIPFEGTAVAGDGSPIPADRLSWWVDLHHETHTHPFVPRSTGASGVAVVPTMGETSTHVFYRFHFEAVDERGAAVETTRDVAPRIVRLAIDTLPPGLVVTVDGQPQNPGTIESVVGIVRGLGVLSPQDSGSRSYAFASWSDTGAATHAIDTPAADTTYVATFVDVGPANVAPSCALTVPAAATAGVTTSIAVTATDSDGSVLSVQFYDEGVLVGTPDTLAPYSVLWTPSSSGAHTLTAVANDEDGAATACGAMVVSVAVGTGDTAPPTCVLTSPAEFAPNLIGAVMIAAQATDDIGVAFVAFEVDGMPVGAPDADAPYEATLLSTDAYAAGQHVIRARATDAAGNSSPWATAVVRFGGSASVGAGFTREVGWAPGLNSATAMAFAPDGRLFVCEQGGSLRVVIQGVAQATPFVSPTVDNNGERGLLGVAFDPAFASNGFVYVYYTVPGSPPHNRVSRFVANGDVAVVGSEQILFELPDLTTATNHNGGAMHFGPDGKLYVAVGENATSLNSQDDTNVLGKLLRLNPDGTIPADNPYFATNSGQARANWVKGLRNPFTFAFQAGTGRIHINDVGQNTWEEINVGVAGANFGWPSTEGRFNAVTYPLLTAPRFVYGRPSNAVATTRTFLSGYAIIGATFYDPAVVAFPSEYAADYFFADYVNGWIARMDLDRDENVNTFANMGHAIVDLAVGPDGMLYVLGRAQVSRITAP